MKLITTTLTSNNEAIIGDALRSICDWVDLCLVIDTGVTDRSLDIAQDIAGSKYRCVHFPWCQDFSQARNFALQAAADLGGDWAITVDTDERLIIDDPHVFQNLDKTDVGTWLVLYENGYYAKERIFQLPTKGYWYGPTHEAFTNKGYHRKLVSGLRFQELAKDSEQCRKKFERDLQLLQVFTQEHPTDPRFFFYLGETYKNMGRLEEAIPAYQNCSALRGWDEEAAWACYRAAQCLSKLRRYPEAIQLCSEGLTNHPGIGELAWLAGFCSYQLGHWRNAVAWSQMAVSLGYYQGCGQAMQRISFRELNGLFEGPFDVLRFAWRALGNEQAADIAEAEYHKALASNQSYQAQPR